LPRLFALVAAALVAVVLAVPPVASASKFMQLGIFDDTQILHGATDRVYRELNGLGVQVVRVNLWWGGPAGMGVAKRKPRNPTNPNDPAYDWSVYDRAVQYATQYNVRLVFSLLGTPPWANRAKGWNVAPTNVLDFKRFATAAARRYRGDFIGPDGRTLGTVRSWLVWNEPNNPVFLKPQYKRAPGGRWTLQGAKDYATLCNAAVDAIHLTTVGAAKVACGVTGPRGNNNPNSPRASLSPLAFLRAIKAAGARRFDAYAHHPYYGSPVETPLTPPPPGIHGNAPTAITLGNFPLLIREVTRLYGNKRIWITEYGYQTNPPDRAFGVSYAKQALYLRQAYGWARRNPRIDMFLWFLLRDERRLDGWQSGLMTFGGARKPAYRTFSLLRA
jgi:Glycosyl hydrolase catalytic core